MAKATENSVLEGKPRKAVNKNEARRVRRGGLVPAVLYGAGKETASLSVEPREVLRILNSETGHNTIFDLTLNDEKTRAMIVDWQYEPIKGALLHVDFKRIAMDKVLRVKVPILLKGESVGVKQHGGIMEQILREIDGAAATQRQEDLKHGQIEPQRCARQDAAEVFRRIYAARPVDEFDGAGVL